MRITPQSSDVHSRNVSRQSFPPLTGTSGGPIERGVWSGEKLLSECERWLPFIKGMRYNVFEMKQELVISLHLLIPNSYFQGLLPVVLPTFILFSSLYPKRNTTSKLNVSWTSG